MNREDGFKATGKLTIEIKDKDGKVKDSRDLTNLVVDDGLDFSSYLIARSMIYQLFSRISL